MSTFYQSPLWRKINEEVYKKPIFEIELGGTVYWGTTKQMRIAGQEARWSMIHGIRPEAIDVYDELFHTFLKTYKRDHTSHRDLFLQVGIDVPISAYHTKTAVHHEEDALKKIALVQRDFLTWYDIRPTCREHMPQATVVLSTQGTMEERKTACSDSGKRMLNKGQKAGLDFSLASTEEERRAFWKLWYTMSYDKGFAIIPEEQYMSLLHMLTETASGWLFVAKKDGVIVSGSVCLAYEKTLIYLYGATDRAFGNIGAHYWLTMHIRSWAREHNYTQFDLLGIAPPGSDETHYLAGVTRFKESFGGETIVYAGSYDCVCSARGYRAFKLWRGMKG